MIYLAFIHIWYVTKLALDAQYTAALEGQHLSWTKSFILQYPGHWNWWLTLAKHINTNTSLSVYSRIPSVFQCHMHTVFCLHVCAVRTTYTEQTARKARSTGHIRIEAWLKVILAVKCSEICPNCLLQHALQTNIMICWGMTYHDINS